MTHRRMPVKMLLWLMKHHLPPVDTVDSNLYHVPITTLIGLKDMIYDSGLVLQDLKDLVFEKDERNQEWLLIME